MGTKNNPGQFDCYANAEPDEPMFILLGRDPLAAALVKIWALARTEMGEDLDKVTEALACASDMAAYCKGKEKAPKSMYQLLHLVADTLAEIVGSDA